jgi:hypothetical protein
MFIPDPDIFSPSRIRILNTEFLHLKMRFVLADADLWAFASGNDWITHADTLSLNKKVVDIPHVCKTFLWFNAFLRFRIRICRPKMEIPIRQREHCFWG